MFWRADTIALADYSQEKVFQDALYSPASLTGPLEGTELTITGVNFANTDFLQVLVDGEPTTFTYVDVNTLVVDMPAKTIDLEVESFDATVHVCNGGLPLVAGNCGTFTVSPAGAGVRRVTSVW